MSNCLDTDPLPKQARSQWTRAAAVVEDFGMGDAPAQAGRAIGDARQGDDAQTAMDRDDGLGSGAHADEVGAQAGEGADFCRGFERGTADRGVDAVGEGNAFGSGGGVEAVAEIGIVDLGEIDKGRAVGDAAQGVVAHEQEVIGESDEGAGLEIGTDAAGGIGEAEIANSQGGEDANGEGDGGKGMAFVEVGTTGEDGDGNGAEAAEDESAGMTRDGRREEAGEVGVGPGILGFDRGGDVGEAAAQNEPDDGPECGLMTDAGDGLGDAGVDVRGWVRCVGLH